jgi:hypothetical protein
MWSDTDRDHVVGSNVQQVSGGQMGNAVFLQWSGNAYSYDELHGGSPTLVATGVIQVTAGTDENGKAVFGIVYSNHGAWEYRPANNLNNLWAFLISGVQALSKERLGLVDVLFTNGYADARDASDWHFLQNWVTAVA